MKRLTAINPLFFAAILSLPMIILQACSTADNPQNWYEGNGPVIPHDDFPGDCSLCHEGNDWSEVRLDFEFDHLEKTGVALEGAHAQAQCLRCHNDRGPVATFAAAGCAGCHEDVHLTQLGRNCESCHGQETWQPQGQIEAHNMTRFPLVGAHAAASCFRCHPGSEVGLFNPTDTACEACHGDLAANVTAPNHLAQGWVSNCQDCHMATTWRSVGGFGHDDWPLSGAHAAADCLDCHSSGQFTALSTTCFSCHDAEFLGTTDPDHVAKGFATTCQDCHGTSTWQGAIFNHAGISNGCVTCHLTDFQATTNPDHVASGYQTDCEDCHGTVTWEGANFNHVGIVDSCVTCHLDTYQATNDPAHQANGIPTTCEDCHSTDTWLGANFDHNGISSSCVTCHLADYQGTTDPNHQTAGFPTTCVDCHDTVAWGNGTFNHSFPINSGKHSGFNCVECHTTGTTVFSCIDCHEHRQSEADSHHGPEVTGYQWNTAACYFCHPDGVAED